MRVHLALVFVMSIVHQATGGFTCPEYSCGINGIKGEECIHRKEEGGIFTYELEKCGNAEERCLLEGAGPDYNCSITPTLYPGEMCEYPTDCMSGECAQGICGGVEETGVCAHSTQCNLGLFCALDKTCKKVARLGEPCGPSGNHCRSNLVCMNSLCVNMGTLEEGKLSDNKFACSTFYIAKEDGSNDLLCSKGPKINGDDHKCQGTKDMCDYQLTLPSGQTKPIQQPCLCGLSEDGAKYCPVGKGDIITNITHFFEYVSSVLNTKECPLGHPYFCNLVNQTSKEYAKAYLGYMQATASYTFYDNPQCVKDMFTQEYWAMYEIAWKPEPGPPPHDFASSFHIALTLLFPLIFLFL